jgi:cation transport ATPase
MAEQKTLNVPITGMDCADCVRHVQHAIARVPGVDSVDVFLSSEKAVVRFDPTMVELPAIRQAVEGAGYGVAEVKDVPSPTPLGDFSGRILRVLGIVFGVVLLVIVGGEWLGLLEQLTARVPFVVGAAIVVLLGLPLFYKVIRAALNGQILSHTLMTLGVVAALAVGQWTTAAIVVLFMYVGDYVERFTSEGARRAVRDLTAMAPQTARVEREGVEREVPIAEVEVGETVIVRPGERIPVDGEVVSGQATVDQAAITGEPMPVDVGPGAQVLAATVAQLGSVRVRVTRVGADTTFGRVITLV